MKAHRHPSESLRTTRRAVAHVLAAVVALAFAVGAVGAAPAQAGAAAGAPAQSAPYYLPLPAGSSALITQGNGGPYTHTRRGTSEFAWDFFLPTGSLVVAAAEGTVVAVEQGFRSGGLSDDYVARANYVVLAHDDGRYSNYLHLAFRGVLVEVGERVYAGQGIALSGATGYASGPHLHFQVQSTSAPWGAQSVPVRFVDAGVPVTGDRPVSANLYHPQAPSQRVTAPGLLVGPSGDLLTHQSFPIDLQWVSGIADAAPVRVMTADASGERRQVGGRAVADVAGSFTVWAEYYDGVYWRTAADAAGRPAAVTRVAVERAGFLSRPGLTAQPLALTPGGTVSASFVLANLDEEDVSLYDLTLTATQQGGSRVETAAPVRRRVYLQPGESAEWKGTVTLTEPGVYVLSPRVLDPAGRPVPLPAAEWGDPENLTVVVTAPDPPDHRIPGFPHLLRRIAWPPRLRRCGDPCSPRSADRLSRWSWRPRAPARRAGDSGPVHQAACAHVCTRGIRGRPLPLCGR